jgi:hypothetical protein
VKVLRDRLERAQRGAEGVQFAVGRGTQRLREEGAHQFRDLGGALPGDRSEVQMRDPPVGGVLPTLQHLARSSATSAVTLFGFIRSASAASRTVTPSCASTYRSSASCASGGLGCAAYRVVPVGHERGLAVAVLTDLAWTSAPQRALRPLLRGRRASRIFTVTRRP